ncbi:MAG: gliding motility-associated C-terminal domain-containing protein [Flavobacteriales bacterium]|nr:gliding motility-associated C-terminal domain-containing protein [Flavobacteriales bacterium]
MAEQKRLLFPVKRFVTGVFRSLVTLLPALAAILLLHSEALATHAMGGDITYECLGNNQYRVNMNFFRDCNGVDAPSNCNNGRSFRVRSTTCGANFTACFSLQSVQIVTPICPGAVDRCNSSSGQYGVERYRYTAVIDLSAWANCGTDWVIDWSLCCRNNAITSLNNPGGKDLYLSAELNNTITPCNSSPRFLNDPIPFGCVNQPIVYNHGVSDLAGDSLRFELAPARGTNGAILPYNAGYTFTQPVITSGGANAVTIDPQTGTIRFTPSIAQFAVVTVLVTEFRNGVRIGRYTRDLQFAIIACNNNNPSVSGINGTNSYVFDVCAGTNFCFDVTSTDLDAAQIVTMNWNNAIPGATFTTTGGPRPVGTFCWNPTAADIGSQIFTVNVVDNACALSGSGTVGYLINVTPPLTPANAGPDQSICGFSTTLAGLQPYPSIQGTWTVVNGTGTFANPNNRNTTVSGLTAGVNTFRWSLNYLTCGIAADEMIVNAYDPNHPIANAGPAQDLCLPTNSTTFAANNAISPAVGSWALVSGSGTVVNPNSPTSQVNNLGQGTNVFRWTVDNGACTPATSSNVTIRVFSNLQTAANAGPDQQLCSPNLSTTLAGNVLIAPATGQWTVTQGTGTFANASLRNTTVSGLSIGTNRMRWSISNGPCTPPTTTDEMDIVVFNPASPNANAGPAQQVCDVTTTLAGNSPLAPATGVWTVVSGTGTFVNLNSPTTVVNGLSIGANVFQWTLSNGPCANATTTSQVTITRFSGAVIPLNAGPDQDLCSIGVTGVASTTMAATAVTAPGTGAWTVVSGSATIADATSPTTAVSNIPVGVTTLRWTISNGPCTPNPNTDDVVIRVFNRNAPVAAAGPAQNLCAPVASVTLAGNAATAPATGTWTVISGNGTFGNLNSPSSTVTGMALGVNVYRWTINNGPCPGAITSSDVTITLFNPGIAAVNAGPDQNLCGSTSATLVGSAVSAPAIGTWSVVSGGATIANANSAITSIAGLGSGTVVMRWSVNNGPCGNTSDDVTIRNYDPNNPVANAGPDLSICIPVAPNSVTMAGSAIIAPAVGTWTLVSGGGTIAAANSPTTQITAMPVGINVFRWAVNNGPCPNGATADTIRVLVYSDANPVANAGPDQSLCTTNGSATMAGSSIIVPAIGTWTLVSGTGTITQPNNPATTITGMGVGQNIFQWTVNNGPCANGLTTDQMSFFIFDPSNPPASAGADQSLCTSLGNTIQLEGSPVIFPATGVWTMVGSPGTITNPNSAITEVTGLSVGNYSFTWTVNNGVCPNPISSSASILVVADGTAQAALAGPDQSVCGSSSVVTMAANPATGVATGAWSVEQGSATFVDGTSATTQASGLSIGLNILRWTIDNGACGFTSDLITIFVYDPNNPVANAGPDQSLCTPTLTTTLVGSSLIIPAVGQWTLVSGSGTIANPTSPSTAISGLAVGENVFRWQVNNGACPSPITNDLVSVFVYDNTATPANAGPDQQVCTPTTSVTMAGNTPIGSAVGTWTRIQGTGTINAPNSPTTTVSQLAPGVNIFQWSINNGTCGTSTDQMTVFVFDANNPVANAGPNQQLCTPTLNTTLAGSNIIVPATGTWTLVSGSGVIANPTLRNSPVSGLAVGENVFRWSVSNGPCPNSQTNDLVSIFVFDATNPVADAGADRSFCTPDVNTTLQGSAVIFPATGVWTVQGPATVVNPNNPNSAVTGMGVGVNIFTWTVSNGPCPNGNTSDAVSLTVFDASNPVADAGPDQELCTPNTNATMAGSSIISPAVGTWTLISGQGTITSPNAPNTGITGLAVGENIFEWTVSNGPCADGLTTDRVSILVFDENNPIANAGVDQELCTPNTITTLEGSSVIFPATGEWVLVSGTGDITDPTDPSTTVTDLGVGENIFSWTVSNGPCANGLTTDNVSIFLFDIGNPPANAGPDQELCTPNTTTTMQGSPVIFPAVGTWTVISGSAIIADINDPNTSVSQLLVGETVLQWQLDNGACDNTGDLDQVSIFVFDENQPAANAGTDQELCTTGLASTTLAGSAITFPAVGTWTLVSGSGTIADPNNPASPLFDLPVGENVFQWTVENGPCANALTSDQVSIFVFDQGNLTADAGPDQDLCTPTNSANLSGSALIFPATGTWSIISGTGIITDPNSPNTTITGLVVGNVVVQWRVSNGPCQDGITTDQMTIRLFDENNPVADAGPDQELCSDVPSTLLQGSAIIAPADGLWELVSGVGTIVDPTSPTTAVTDLEIGENIFRWTVSNGPCANALTEDLVSIFVFDVDNVDANAGPDQQVCTPLTGTTLIGSPYTFPATGIWTVVTGSGTIADPTSSTTTVTLGIGVNEFQWEVYNGACANQLTSDVVEVVLFDADAPPAAAGPDQELCSPDLSTTVTGNDPVGAATGQWALVEGAGVIGTPDQPTTDITDLEIGRNTFTWTLQGGPCVTTVDSVSIYVFDPENPLADAGLDQELCMPQDSTLMAGSNLIFPATGVWTTLAGTGIPQEPGNPGTLFTNMSVGLNSFRWEVYNGPCANSLTSDTVDVILYDDTTASANAGPDLEQCLPLTSQTLQGEQPPLPAEGTWTVFAGTGVFTDENDPNSEVTGLTQGENVFIWTLEWDPCPNNGTLTDTVVVRLFDPLAPLADAGPDQELCMPPDSTSTLAGNTPATPGVGTWSVFSGTAVIAEANNPNSAVSGLGVGLHELVWTIYNGMCGFGPPSTDTLRIRVYDASAPNALTGESISACTPVSSVTLGGNAAVFPAIGTWTIGSGAGTFVDPNDPTTVVNDLVVGQHDFVWTIDNGACGTSSSGQTVLIYDDQAPTADAGPDQELCLPDPSTDLSANAVVFPASGVWTITAGQGTFADLNDPLSNVTGLAVGTNTFVWNINNGPCGTTTDEVTIVVFDDQQPIANAGADQSFCTPVTSTTLEGSAVTFPATGTWVFLEGSANLSDPNNPTAALDGLSPGVYVLQWLVDNGPCVNGITTDEVTISVFNGEAPAAAAGPDMDFCTPIVDPVTMLASSATAPATGMWSLVSGNGVLVDPSDPFTTVTDLGLGANVFEWNVDNGPCGVSSDQVTFSVYDHTVEPANAGEDLSQCEEETTAQLQADPATSTASGIWTRISGSGDLEDPTDPNTMVTGLLQGNNLFVWTLSNGPCDGTADTVLVYVKDCLTLVIPNAFSPNGDGTNDTYVITNIENYQNNTFTVFNRWGNKVFESTPYVNTWDGTSQFGSVYGEKLPESTYYYVLDPGTGGDVFNGFIYLRR